MFSQSCIHQEDIYLGVEIEEHFLKLPPDSEQSILSENLHLHPWHDFCHCVYIWNRDMYLKTVVYLIDETFVSGELHVTCWLKKQWIPPDSGCSPVFVFEHIQHLRVKRDIRSGEMISDRGQDGWDCGTITWAEIPNWCTHGKFEMNAEEGKDKLQKSLITAMGRM